MEIAVTDIVLGNFGHCCCGDLVS